MHSKKQALHSSKRLGGNYPCNLHGESKLFRGFANQKTLTEGAYFGPPFIWTIHGFKTSTSAISRGGLSRDSSPLMHSRQLPSACSSSRGIHVLRVFGIHITFTRAWLLGFARSLTPDRFLGRRQCCMFLTLHVSTAKVLPPGDSDRVPYYPCSNDGFYSHFKRAIAKVEQQKNGQEPRGAEGNTRLSVLRTQPKDGCRKKDVASIELNAT